MIAGGTGGDVGHWEPPLKVGYPISIEMLDELMKARLS